MAYVMLRALLCALALGAVGFGAGLVILSDNRCGGPACAGLGVVPIALGAFGAAVGLVLGIIAFWIRRAYRRPLKVAGDLGGEAVPTGGPEVAP